MKSKTVNIKSLNKRRTLSHHQFLGDTANSPSVSLSKWSKRDPTLVPETQLSGGGVFRPFSRWCFYYTFYCNNSTSLLIAKNISLETSSEWFLPYQHPLGSKQCPNKHFLALEIG